MQTKTFNLVLLILLLLFVQRANGATIVIHSVSRFTQSFGAPPLSNTQLGAQFGSTTSHSGGGSPGEDGYTASDQHADQNSTIEISDGVLNVQGKVNCDASTDGGTPANAGSYIIIDFTIDSPFRFTNKTTCFQLKRIRPRSEKRDVTFVSLVDNLNHQTFSFGYNEGTYDRASGNVSGILPAGGYKFTAESSLQCELTTRATWDLAARVPYTNHSSFSTFLSLSPISTGQPQMISDGSLPSAGSKPPVSVNIKPFIFVVPMGVNQIQMKWDTNYVGYFLEETSDLTFTNWMPVTNAVNLIRQQYSVTVDTSKPNAFFRLHKN